MDIPNSLVPVRFFFVKFTTRLVCIDVTKGLLTAASAALRSIGDEVHLLWQIFVEVPLVQQQVVLLVGPVHAVRALEARLLSALVLYMPLQRALVLVFVPAVHAFVHRPPALTPAHTH